MSSTDFGIVAQKAAEAHLQACMDALDAEQDGDEIQSPASAPFCGCDTCCVREVLFAAWPFLLKEAGQELGSFAKSALLGLQTAVMSVELLADGVGAEQEDQPDPDGDQRGHDVEP